MTSGRWMLLVFGYCQKDACLDGVGAPRCSGDGLRGDSGSLDSALARGQRLLQEVGAKAKSGALK